MVGIVSGALFCASMPGEEASGWPPFLRFSALIPLFAIGYVRGKYAGLTACLTACLTAMALDSAAMGATFALLGAIPAGIFIWVLLKEPTAKTPVPGLPLISLRYAPLSHAIEALSLLSMLLLMGFAAYEWHTQTVIEPPANGRAALEAAGDSTDLATPEMPASETAQPIVLYGLEGIAIQTVMEIYLTLTDTIPPVEEASLIALFVPGIAAWLWVLTFLAYAKISHWLIRRTPGLLRPTLQMDGTPPSLALLVLTSVSGLITMVGSPQITFIGKILFIICLLPYFLDGMFRVHQKIRQMATPENQWVSGATLVGLYGMLFLFVLPMVMMIALGSLIRQCLAYMPGFDDTDMK